MNWSKIACWIWRGIVESIESDLCASYCTLNLSQVWHFFHQIMRCTIMLSWHEFFLFKCWFHTPSTNAWLENRLHLSVRWYPKSSHHNSYDIFSSWSWSIWVCIYVKTTSRWFQLNNSLATRTNKFAWLT